MITVSNVSLTFGGQKLFSGADLKFLPGNCYGIIGANGAGKSTFLKILSGELEPTTGSVTIPPNERMSTLKQDQFMYDAYPVLDTVIMGNQRLYDIMKEKDALYAKPDFSEADGEKAAELEGEFAEMDGWNAESDAATLLTGLGIPAEEHTMLMSELQAGDKFKVLLAQALFGNPDILLLDEPTNHLDMDSREVLENALRDFPGTIIAVSHDRYFINRFAEKVYVLDGREIREYLGDYDSYLAKVSRDAAPDGSGPQQTRTALEKEKRRSREEERKARELKDRLKAAEQAISKAEADAAALEEKLADPEIWKDPEAAAETTRRYNALKEEIDRLYGEYEELEENLSL
jgi:ATPase subunit of ABC transporter with duplicated ATPase domains